VALPIEVDGGGTVGAVPFRITYQHADVLSGPGRPAIDAMTIGVRGTIYGIDFQFTLPRAEWQGAGPQALAYLYASNIQEVGGHDHVIGIQYAQDTDAAGFLTDVLYVTVATTAVDQTAVATVPFSALGKPRAFQIIDDTYHTLQVVGALTGS
jgi:hypothetical protein